MSQAERDCINQFNRECDARQAHYEQVTGQAGPNTEPTQATQQAGPPHADAEAPHAAPDEDEDVPEVRTKLQAVAYGSPEDVLLPDADRYYWRGKRNFESPRDMMRPYLEKVGRLDLLECYSDEIIQYGDLVEYKIDGKWR